MRYPHVFKMRSVRPILVLVGAIAVLAAACSTTTTTTVPWHERNTTIPVDASSTTTTTMLVDPGVDVTVTTVPGTGGGDDVQMRDVDIYIDGWSYAVLGDADLLVQAEGRPGGQVVLTPMSGDEVSGFIQTHPEWAAQVAARMVNTDTGWECSDAGTCENSSGAVDDIVSLLSDPSTIPGYGESYRSWGIASSIYHGTGKVEASSTALDLYTSDGASSAYGTENEGALSSEDGAVFVAMGLGAIFEPDAVWGTGDVDGAFVYYNVGEGGAPGTSVTRELDEVVRGAGRSGLSDVTAAGHLGTVHPSELTFMTSPTTGCGTWVVCVPGTGRGELVSMSTVDVDNVCTVSSITESGSPEKLTAVFTDETRSVTLPVATHLNGVWGGQTPELFPRGGPEEPGSRLFGVPPLASGTVDLRVLALRVYTSDSYGVASLWSSVGKTFQIGADPDDVVNGDYDFDDMLAMFSGALKPCN